MLVKIFFGFGHSIRNKLVTFLAERASPRFCRLAMLSRHWIDERCRGDHVLRRRTDPRHATFAVAKLLPSRDVFYAMDLAERLHLLVARPLPLPLPQSDRWVSR